ncbi:MAG: OmpP1/FadL family transporter [Kiritimatiellaeota bacterium]|nr:OmpP1/FadL family transporter [Kiritimatiellota bacterium]
MKVNVFHTVSAGVVSALAMAAVTDAQAAGFGLYEESAKGNAMGGAVVGRTPDASAVQVNPANMTDTSGFQSMVGVTAIGPAGKIKTPEGNYKLSDQWFAPPHAYVTWQPVDEVEWLSPFRLGVGLYSEFGMGTSYSGNWAGRYNAIETKLESFTISPSIAYKFFDKLSVGAGFRAMYMDFYNDRLLRTPDQSLAPLPGFLSDYWGPTMGRTSVHGDGWGFGWLAGIKYEVLDNLDVGIVYRSRVRMHIEGDGWYEPRAKIPTGPYAPYLPIAPRSHSADGNATVILPSSATAGANYYLFERKLNLGAAVTWTEWSTYDALNVTFAKPLIPGVSESIRSPSEKDWNDVWRFGFGASYNLTESLSVMAGYVYDMCPINSQHTDFMMPAGDRHIFGVGVGYALDNWFVNVGYNYLMMVETTRTVDNGGKPLRATFSGMDAHMFAISTGVNF